MSVLLLPIVTRRPRSVSVELLRAKSGVGKLSATQPDSTRGERTRFDQRSRWHITRTRLAGCLPPGRVSEGGEGLPIRPEPLA